ncbi:MAG: DUF6504 family protein [Parvibaculaceae bacterium]
MSGQRRIISVFLPHWPVDRFYRTHSPELDRCYPLALVAPDHGGMRITSLNKAAEAEGLMQHQRLADAMALYRALDVRDADVDGDRADLKKLSDWCGRYTPWTAPDPNGLGCEPDGILMDITGSAHLFGGEDALIKDIAARFKSFHIHTRIAAAATTGAAWALARFGDMPLTVLEQGHEEKALASLPVAALRLPDDVVNALSRLGLKCVGDLSGRARAPLTARFGRVVTLRLDEALGFAAEPISPEAPLVPYRVRTVFAEGLTRHEDIETALAHLASELCDLLGEHQKGARALELLLFRVDGHVTRLQAGTSAASRDSVHLTKLFREKFVRADDEYDAGFGIEAMSFAALAVDPLIQKQTAMAGETAHEPDIDGLMDRLSNRLGPARVTRLASRASHIPEHASYPVPVLRHSRLVSAQDWRVAALERRDGALARPLRMLAAPEPIDVTAEIPEGPPRHFRWRRMLYQITRAEGPERIAPEWWRNPRDRTRDYYRVEDANGRRFWLYRDGLYTRDEDVPRWYIQGIFG